MTEEVADMIDTPLACCKPAPVYSRFSRDFLGKWVWNSCAVSRTAGQLGLLANHNKRFSEVMKRSDLESSFSMLNFLGSTTMWLLISPLTS